MSGKIDSGSGSVVSDKRGRARRTPRVARATASSRSCPGPPPSRHTSASRSSTATDGPWKNCSTDSPSVAIRDVSRIFSAPSAAVHWLGPAPISSSSLGGGWTPRSRASAASTASGTSSSPSRDAPRATASCASRIRAPRWLAVKAAQRSCSTVSMSTPGEPRPPITTTGMSPAPRSRSSTSVEKRFVFRWLMTRTASLSRTGNPYCAASIAWTATASTPASRNSQTAWFAACQLVPVPTTTRRRPPSRSACDSTGATSASSVFRSSGWRQIVARITLVTSQTRRRRNPRR